ncbi:MAG: protein kinase [Myxococcaceae bacterium]|nr:protein kinase [Myxococcaceae bacterium]
MKEMQNDEQPTVPSRPVRHIEPGQTLGRYRLLDELGRGGMGVVFLAEDTSLHRKVAVKLLAGGDALADNLRVRFEREARAMARLSHRNVVAVHDFGFHEGTPFIVMELITGTSLRRWLSEALRPRPPVVAKFIEAGQGLVAAHAESLVHRDFKPENVLLAADGRAVVTDFGIARDLVQASPETVEPGAAPRSPELTSASSLIGTPRYMAPEQFALEPVSERTDQFSFGVALYEALYAQHPFLPSDTDKSPVAVGAKMVAAKLEPAPEGSDVPKRLHEVLQRLLQADPAARFASMQQALGALESIDVVPDAPKPRSRAPAVIALAGVTVAALATAWVFVPRGLPAGVRTVSVACVPGPGTSAFVAAATCRLATQRWCDAPQPYRCAEGAAANVPLVLTVAAARERVNIDVTFAGAPIASGSGASSTEVLEQLATPVRTFVGERRAPLEPSEGEVALARRRGTTNIDAFRKYQRLEHLGLGVIHEDRDASLAAADELERLDPGWAHPWASELITIKATGERANETLASARAAVTDPTRDPAGSAMLDALAAIRARKLPAAINLLKPQFEQHPDDGLLGFLLYKSQYIQRLGEDALATARKLNETLPQLQFGADLAGQLFEAGRTAELAELGVSWLQRAPACEQALYLQLSLAVERGDAAAVRRLADDALRVHGPSPHRWSAVCDALTNVGLLEEAHPFADRLTASNGLLRADGLERDAVLAVYEGRFAAARQAFFEAASAYDEREMPGDGVHALDGLTSVEWLLGDTEAATKASQRLANAYRDFREPELEAVVRYELELANGRCPAPEPFVAGLSSERERAGALTAMRRGQAAAGCGDCAKVLQQGFAAVERSTRSLHDLGRCALAAGQHAVAAEAFTRASSLAVGLVHGNVRYSPVYRMLSRYQLAAVLEKQGRGAEARARYEAFLTGWGVAEAQVPEVKLARDAVQRLK